MARQLPATLHLRDDLRVERGAARLRAESSLNADGHTEDWNVTGKVSDLAARLGQKLLTLAEPATLVAKLERDGQATKLRTARRSVELPDGDRPGRPRSRASPLTATLDLAAFRERFRDWIDLGTVELAGQGKLDGLYKRQGEAVPGRAQRVVSRPAARRPAAGRETRAQQADDRRQDRRPVDGSGWPVSWNELSVHAVQRRDRADAVGPARRGRGRARRDGGASIPLRSNGAAAAPRGRAEGEVSPGGVDNRSTRRVA